ncbi:1675_t:CDS:1 [Dentiscutata erythropus]|uniref:1675_t:CDS:1 n=1 Tax=Dentiscutata erythropus TaxID=1348616 RepID=A0A9N9BTP9_9GLOM|nr:1675_t:CDS:1 [Dentiscutata erythropus]
MADERLFLEFIQHKLKTVIPSINLPSAIASKLKHRDTAFFKFFLHNKSQQPNYQIEFNILMSIAIEKYKHQHNAYLVNKNNRNQIYDKLRKKITIDSLVILNIDLYSNHISAQYIYYLMNFSRIEIPIQFKQARRLIGLAQTNIRDEIPPNPNQIPVDIIKIILFTLPLQDNSKKATIVKALRLLYKFSHSLTLTS